MTVLLTLALAALAVWAWMLHDLNRLNRENDKRLAELRETIRKFKEPPDEKADT